MSKSPVLINSARQHSVRMGELAFFSHHDHLGRGPADRVLQAGYGPYIFVGENIAAGTRTPTETLEAWTGSPSHCRLLIDPNPIEAGVGMAQVKGIQYWTFNCARPALRFNHHAGRPMQPLLGVNWSQLRGLLKRRR